MVKARKSILFTEGSPEVERKSEHLFDIMITLFLVVNSVVPLRAAFRLGPVVISAL